MGGCPHYYSPENAANSVGTEFIQIVNTVDQVIDGGVFSGLVVDWITKI